MDETELQIRMRRLEEERAEFEMEKRNWAGKKEVGQKEAVVQPGQGVLFPSVKKKDSSPDWDGPAITTCGECGADTKFQVSNWDNGKKRDLRFRPWKAKP